MPTAKWVTVRDSIAQDIRNGTYQIGDRIPTPVDLVQAYDCDRNTIRRALTYLRDAGYITTHVGAGTYVAAIPPTALPPEDRRPSLEERVTALERRLDKIEGRG